MLDVIAYVLVTFFLFTTSLAILEIKARIDHKPNTRINEHEQMLTKSFSFKDNPIDNGADVHLNSIDVHKDTVETEHTMIPKKIVSALPNIVRSDEIQRAVQKVQERITEKPKMKVSELDVAPEDDLDKLIAQFEAEVDKSKVVKGSVSLDK